MSQYLNGQNTNNSILQTISGNTDGIEGLISISNGLLTELTGQTFNIISGITETNTHLSNIEGYVDDVETLISGSNISLGVIEQNTFDTATGVTEANTHLTNIEGYVDQVEPILTGISQTLDDIYVLQTGDSLILSDILNEISANTILLQQIEQNTSNTATGVTEVNTHLTNIEGYVDQVEPILTGISQILDDIYALQTGDSLLLQQIEQNTSNTTTGITEANTHLTNIEGYVDQVEPILTGISQTLDDIYALQTGDSLLLQQIEQNTFDTVTGVTEINTHLTNIEGYVDQVEPILTGISQTLDDLYALQTGCCENLNDIALNTFDTATGVTQSNILLSDILNEISANTALLQQIEQNTFDTATGVTEANTHLVNIEGYIDQVEPLLTGINAELQNLNANITPTTGVTILNTILNPVPVDATVSFPVGGQDLLGAMVTSEKTILATYMMDKDNQSLILDRQSNVGGAHSYANRVNTQTVTLNGAFAITQSFQRHPYYSGVPMRIELTFQNFHLESNVIKEVGYYQTSMVSPYNTNYDGLFMESDGATSTYNICIARDGVITRIPRSSWNDRLDGTAGVNNPSGLNIDFTKFTVMVIEFLYLGGTAARFGFVFGDTIVWAHTYQHSNLIVSTIIGSPQHPVRWSIRSVGGTGTLIQICGAVSALGKVSDIGQHRSAFSFANAAASAAFINANTAGLTYLVRAIRLSSTAINTVAMGISAAIWAATADDMYAHLILNPTFVNAPTWLTLPDSNVEFAYGETATAAGDGSLTRISAGTILSTHPIGSVNRESMGDGYFDSARRLGMGIDGTRNVIAAAVTITNTGGAADMYGGLNFIEF